MEAKKLDFKNYKLVKFFLIKSEVIYIILSLLNYPNPYSRCIKLDFFCIIFFILFYLIMERNEDAALDLEVF